MPFDEPEHHNYDPKDPDPCRYCTPENCEWWGMCPHTPKRKDDGNG